MRHGRRLGGVRGRGVRSELLEGSLEVEEAGVVEGQHGLGRGVALHAHQGVAARLEHGCQLSGAYHHPLASRHERHRVLRAAREQCGGEEVDSLREGGGGDGVPAVAPLGPVRLEAAVQPEVEQHRLQPRARALLRHRGAGVVRRLRLRLRLRLRGRVECEGARHAPQRRQQHRLRLLPLLLRARGAEAAGEGERE
eukprot:446549-Rhodomonas_salina.2